MKPAKVSDEDLQEVVRRISTQVANDVQLDLFRYLTGEAAWKLRRQMAAFLEMHLKPELLQIRDVLQEPAEPPNPLAPAVATQ